MKVEIENDVKNPNIKVEEQIEEKISVTSVYCEICKIQFANIRTYQNHKRKHDQRPFSCLNCGKQFFGMHVFQSHMRNYQWFTCEICGKDWPTGNKGRHIKNCIVKQEIKAEKKEYICNYCEYKTPKKQSYERHKLSWHTKISCKNCDEMFDNNVILQQHIRKNHPNPRPINPSKKGLEKKRCKWPNCSYTSNHNLKRHERVCLKRQEDSVSFIWY